MRVGLAFCLSLVLFLLGISPLQAQEAGLLDLRTKFWGQGDVFTLDGDWQFLPGQLLGPDEFPRDSAAAFPVPGLWNHPPHQLPVEGVATLAVQVLLPKSLGRIHLAVPDMPSAYRLWSNGQLVASNGVVAASADHEVPAFGPRLLTLESRQGQLDLLLQISNFHYKEGGIWHSFRLADDSGFTRLRERPLLLDLFQVGLLVALGLFLLSVYLFRRQEKASLYFGLFCLMVAGRTLLVGERVFYSFDLLSWATLQRLEHSFFFLTLPLFASFYHAFYPRQTHAFIHKALWWLALLLMALTWLTPVKLFAQLGTPFQLLILGYLVYIAVTYVAIVRQREQGAVLFGLSFLLLLVSVTVDLLATHFLLQVRPSIHLGIIGFAVTLAAALNRRYVTSLNLVEALSVELQERNQQLESMDAYKNEFLAVTSHELRTPLHAMGGLARSILEQARPTLNEAQVQNLELICASSERLGKLVNDILDYSALKHGRLALQITDVDLPLLARQVLAALEPLAAGRELVVSMEVDAGIRYVRADADRLQQILFNLMGNAIKFTEEGFVLLKVSRQSQEVVLEVIDTGVGIPADELPLLLQSVHEFKSGPASQSGGLGLSISRKLIESHASHLQIESRPHMGTRVSFSLPVSEPEGLPQAPAARMDGESGPQIVSFAVRQPSLNHSGDALACHRVFVVDDEEINRHLLRNQLESHGYAVETFAGAASLIERLQTLQPDLLLLDLMMPGMNGFAVCSRLREQFNAMELPIVMLTARHQSEDIVTALNCGANDYLTKPYVLQELLARVNSQLRVRESWLQQQENQRLYGEIQQHREVQVALTANQAQLQSLLESREATLESLMAERQPSAIEPATGAASPSPVMPESTDSRSLLVELLRLALNLWERYGGKGKVQLAEESRCWRVYIDGSTVKTRTLDKYLSLKTLPDNPRWRLVVRTANFVLSQCDIPMEEQEALRRLISKLESCID